MSPLNVQVDGSVSLDELAASQHIYSVDPLRSSQVPPRPDSHSSVLWNFITSIKLGTDLTRVQAPLFMERGKSGLEAAADLSRPTTELLNLRSVQSPLERMRIVARWMLEPLADVPTEGCVGGKPYNSTLGEVFECKYPHPEKKDDAKATTFFFAEQVSHHPPISASCWYNEEAKMFFGQTTGGSVKFHGNSITILPIGECTLSVVLDNGTIEHYVAEEKPGLTVKGLIFGSAHVDICSDGIVLTCKESGYSCQIDFSSGATIEGKFKDQKGNKVARVVGSLRDKAYFIDLIKNPKAGKKPEHGVQWIDFQDSHLRSLQKEVPPIAEQKPNESRRLWHSVTHALWESKDIELAAKNKGLIEEHQRNLRKQGQQYTPQLFQITSRQNKYCGHAYDFKNKTDIWDRMVQASKK